MDDISANPRSVGAGYTPPASSTLESVLTDGSDAKLRRVIHNLLSAGDMLEDLRTVMGDRIGLTGGQYQILMAIARLQNGRGVPIKDVAAQLRVVASHVTVEVGKMVKLGFLEKLANAEDKRSVLVALTQKGCQSIDSVTSLTAAVNDGLFDGVSREDFQKFGQLLDKFVSNAESTLATTQFYKQMADLKATRG